eukprot:scaffold79068_cov28-Tisochrysis_lutea.AAC.2
MNEEPRGTAACFHSVPKGASPSLPPSLPPVFPSRSLPPVLSFPSSSLRYFPWAYYGFEATLGLSHPRIDTH